MQSQEGVMSNDIFFSIYDSIVTVLLFLGQLDVASYSSMYR